MRAWRSAPEEIAAASAALDLVVGTIDCFEEEPGGPRGIAEPCLTESDRIPIDALDRVAMPNFLAHTTVPGDQVVDVSINVAALAETPGGGRSLPAPIQGVSVSHDIVIPANTPTLIGLAASSSGEARETGTPHCFGEPATIVGTDLSETIDGTDDDDVIVALGGDDTIRAKDGDDLVCAGAGEDEVRGGDGADRIAGQEDDDEINADRGDDVVYGGEDDDDIRGGDGNDLLEGDEGNDEMRGDRGDDTMLGGVGNDDMKGGSGSDLVLGGQDVDIDITLDAGFVTEPGGERGAPLPLIEFSTPDGPDDDIVDGGRNDDRVDGGPGADVVKGNKGNDAVAGGFGDDEVNGGGGNGDTCVDADGDPADFKACENL